MLGLRGCAMSDKRTSAGEIAQGDLFGLADGCVNENDYRAGARRAGEGADGAGGEYLEMCGAQNFCPDADPRFADLRRIGLPRAWLMVAETIGFDAWLEVWRRISADESLLHDGGQRMPKLRSFDAYLRFQRNRYIDALAARGMSVPQVARAVARNLREPLDEKHVAKIMRRR